MQKLFLAAIAALTLTVSTVGMTAAYAATVAPRGQHTSQMDEGLEGGGG